MSRERGNVNNSVVDDWMKKFPGFYDGHASKDSFDVEKNWCLFSEQEKEHFLWLRAGTVLGVNVPRKNYSSTL